MVKEGKRWHDPRKSKQSVKNAGMGVGQSVATKAIVKGGNFVNAEGKTLASGITDTREEAENALTQVKSDNIRGILASPDQVTLSEYAERWLNQINVREVTRNRYKRELSLIMPKLGKKRVKDVKRVDTKKIRSLRFQTRTSNARKTASSLIQVSHSRAVL
jgi:Phage integrase, N-terminal SAM-like domain